MSLYLDLKGLIAKSGLTMKQVNEELNRRNGTNYSQQNFSKRLQIDSISYSLVSQILDICGYQISWIHKDNP